MCQDIIPRKDGVKMNKELFKVMEVLEALYNNNHNHDLTVKEVDDMLNRSIGSINKILEELN